MGVPARHRGAPDLASLVGVLASGAAAAAVVAGPSLQRDVWIRVSATVVGGVAALVVRRLRAEVNPWLIDGVAVVAAAVALGLAAADAPPWSGTIDVDAAATGAVVAVAVAAVAGVARAAAAMGLERA